MQASSIPIVVAITPCTDCPDAVVVSPKIYLQGAYNTADGLMNDALRAAELIPAVEAPPSTDMLGARTIHGGIFKTSTDNAIVDAVTVELRSSSDATLVLATRAAFVQKDGNVVDVDGISPVIFYGFTPNTYHVAVKHRNHLGVMTEAPVALSGW